MAPRNSEGRSSTQIREALVHVGELMRLPTKRPGAAENAAAAPAPRAESKPLELPSFTGGRVWLPVAAVFLAVVFSAVKFWPSAPPEVPEVMRGEWATTHPKYANSRIAFTANEVVLSTKGGTSTAYPIAEMSSIPHGDSTKYVINYKEGDGLTELRVAFVSTPKPRIVFARPEGLIWEQAGR